MYAFYVTTKLLLSLSTTYYKDTLSITHTFVSRKPNFNKKYDDPTTVPFSRIQAMTTDWGNWGPYTYHWSYLLVSPSHNKLSPHSTSSSCNYYNSMMTRRNPRKDIYGTSHLPSNIWASMGNNPIYFL